MNTNGTTTTAPTITLTVRGYWDGADGVRWEVLEAPNLTDAINVLRTWHVSKGNLSVDLFERRADGTGACLVQLSADGNVFGPLAPLF